MDGNGIWDEGEPGIAGWTIYLDQNKNKQLDEGEISTVTDETGKYSFTNLLPGDYTVAEVSKPDWVQSYPVNFPNTIIQLTDDTSGEVVLEDDYLQIFGNKVVWTVANNYSGHFRGYEIYLYDGNKIVNLSNNTINDYSPQIFGNNVVWSGHDGDWDIYLYDGTEVINLSNNSTHDSSPQIFGNKVVWQGFDGTDNEVYFYNGTEVIQLTNNITNDDAPQIFGDSIVWSGYDYEGDDTEIYLYDGTEIIQLTKDAEVDLDPQIFGKNVVWKHWNYEDNNLTIYYYDGNKINQLADIVTDNTIVQIFGNNIVWLDIAYDPLTGLTIYDDIYIFGIDDTLTVDAGEVVSDVNFGNWQPPAINEQINLAEGVPTITLFGFDNINVRGNALNNTLTGNLGNNILDGGAGDDTLTGKSGDDVYIIDSPGDIISETMMFEGILSDAGGDDSVIASIDYSLPEYFDSSPQFIENLTLSGSGNLKGTGNTLDNKLIGNTGANLLMGKEGNDTLNGGAGKDTLDGGVGNDLMEGGAGNDLYIVDSIGDVVNETLLDGSDAGGIDSITTTVNYTLPQYVENLTLNGNSNLKAIGNNSNNILTGNTGANNLAGRAGNDSLFGKEGNDTLNGGTGDDVMEGGAGNDRYTVDSIRDIVKETLKNGSDAGGIDSVTSSVNYILPEYVENLTLSGSSNLNATGNFSNNILTGNIGANNLTGRAGNDSLRGKEGNDTLNGGTGDDVLLGGEGDDLLTGAAGLDRFNFSGVASFSSLGVDTVVIFAKGSDKIVLSQSLFSALTKGSNLLASEFARISASSSTEINRVGLSEALIVYNSLTGKLFYNPDGATTGLTNGGHFATVNNKPLLDTSDFLMGA